MHVQCNQIHVFIVVFFSHDIAFQSSYAGAELSRTYVCISKPISTGLRMRKQNESGSIQGHQTGKTDLKLDSLCFNFLTLITKLQQHSPFQGSLWGQSMDQGSVFCPPPPNKEVLPSAADIAFADIYIQSIMS